jgi:hypothetical protein
MHHADDGITERLSFVGSAKKAKKMGFKFAIRPFRFGGEFT